MNADTALKARDTSKMSKSDFSGLLPDNFEDFRSVEFWDGFFKARGNKVCIRQQGPWKQLSWLNYC